MAEAYYLCNIPPNQFFEYTPAELEMMTDIMKIKLGIKEAPKQPMTNPEMMAVAQAITTVCQHIPDRGVR